MSIKNYKNIEEINLKTENEGQFIQDKDLFIVSKNETEDTDFGECKYDVMEVSVYDINNNLLPQKSGNNVAYIRTGDIKNYLYNISRPDAALPDGKAQKELAIDIEKLLNDLGFENGILRVNINFVRNRVGTENELRRAWIQEISPTRTEVRIVPLKTTNQFFNEINAKELDNLKNLNKDFKYYRKAILDSLYSFDKKFFGSIDSTLQSRYGNDYINTLKVDFGLKNFEDFKKRIYEDFVTSVEYYLTNRYYDINESNFGKTSETRFEDCDQYDFITIVTEMQSILYKCVSKSTSFLKRRDFSIKTVPQEFKAVDITPDVINVTNISAPAQIVTTVYDAESVVDEPPANESVDVVNNIETIPPPAPVVIPQQIPVATSDDSFYYTIKNNNSLSSLTFRFNDASGTAVEKTLGAGASFTICAKESTVSAAAATIRTIPDNSINRADAGDKDDVIRRNNNAGDNDTPDFSIIKGSPCRNVTIGDTAPVRQPAPAAQPDPPVRNNNRGGQGGSTGATPQTYGTGGTTRNVNPGQSSNTGNTNRQR